MQVPNRPRNLGVSVICYIGLDARLLSNNLAENSMRPVAVGRKNWVHLGSEQAGPRVAAIPSIIESCRRLKIPVCDYLAAVLPGLANLSIPRLADFTPSASAAQQNHAAS
jgi:transposase